MSSKSSLNQIAWFAASTEAMYSASVVDSATPVVDLLVLRSPPQSAPTYPKATHLLE
ncbi:hypothetical protein I307_06603 [Cryptococcus deuterogattii 99/473]|nr:hypothetical protein I307_06603 [Cryptococcus deuterogattii 99/473]